MWDFVHGRAAAEFEVDYTIPSRCAEALRAGTADIGIIPAIAYNSIPNLMVIPDVAIAAKGRVKSILLVSKRPLAEIRTVATDNSSLTSAGLVRVLFEKWYGRGREFRAMPPALDAMLAECDAALIIGDPALKFERSQYLVLDLAQEWHRLTGKPFVFAFWAVREPALNESRPGLDVIEVFQQSRNRGLQLSSVRQIAAEWAPRLRITQENAEDYLTRNIYYFLDDECLAGMQLFFQYAAEYGVISRVNPLRFLQPASAEVLSRRA